jgi:hypothetical protein
VLDRHVLRDPAQQRTGRAGGREHQAQPACRHPQQVSMGDVSDLVGKDGDHLVLGHRL